MPTIDKLPNEMWIRAVLEKGEEQIKKELEDYWNLMGVHSKLLDRVTKGKISKTNYTWEAIKEVLDEIELTKNGVEDETRRFQ